MQNIHQLVRVQYNQGTPKWEGERAGFPVRSSFIFHSVLPLQHAQDLALTGSRGLMFVPLCQ